MKFSNRSHATAREIALEVLLEIEENESYSHLLLAEKIKKSSLSSKDTALLTRLVYGSVQHKNTLDFYLQPFLKKSPESWVRVLLRLSVFQRVYLEKIPEHAIFHEAGEIAKKKGHQGIAGFVNGVLRSIQRRGLPSFADIRDPLERMALEMSHPKWLIEYWLTFYDKETVCRICQSNNALPRITVRVNTLKTDREEVMCELQEEGIAVSTGRLVGESIEIQKGQVQHSAAFQTGKLVIQDESSMLVAHALDIKEDIKVLDGCAAPGGKATHIATRMNNSGHVTALDIHSHQVKKIHELVHRLGLTNITAETLDSRKAGDRFQNASFDRILIDAPCSGFGVIRRKPDIKWRKKFDDVKALIHLQGEILRALAPLLKPGGKLVYSTCTIGKEENAEVIASFLNERHDFSFDSTLKNRLPASVQKYVQAGSMQLLPHDFATDGFYIAVLKRDLHTVGHQ